MTGGQLLVAWPIAVEGACDFHFGRPLDANPYSRRFAADGWASWRLGWLDAADLNATRGDEERARWWRGEAA